MSNNEKYRDPRWQRKRLELFARDNWTCRKCSDKTLPKELHHLCYLPNTDPWDNYDDLMWTLCDRCHKALTDKPTHEELLRALLLALKSKIENELSRRYNKKKSRYLDCIIYLLEEKQP